MRVIVVGAGVAGLAVARGLLNAGHEVEVYEEAPELRTAGGSVSLWPAATAILRELKVDYSTTGRRLETMETWAVDGRRLVTIDLTAAERRYGHPSVHVARRDLVELLADGVPVTYGVPAEHVVPECAEVRLSDGRTVRGDVLVGADGRRSVVREALWGDDRATLGDWVTWQGFTTRPTTLTEQRRAVMIAGARGLCGLIPAGEGRLLWWFDVRSAPGRPFWDGDPRVAERLRERFRGWADPVPDVLETITDIDFFPHHRQPFSAVWGRGPTTLAGDAAHTMPPTMAQGANQALEDAWSLAGAIGGLRSASGRAEPGGALRAYERARAKVVRLPARLAATEITDMHRPFAGFFPDRLATWLYVKWLRRVSTYLLTAS
ncbi:MULTISPECIES: FAD-dependent oxidoreductase [unclassified Nonomuraea]|uniref:FAD-dependent oxidoreductase n=1 Tax=unclassified Nonomuraea TaxID=2593643 RepID=UPI0013765B6D|nr:MULTISPECIES: NAD(P)/FAD-dependent oxidoreductase [unclassified Nonomuraea]NBE94415.1 NAD(P)-binding protein [Nonomuraea sp. K271]